MERYSAVQMPTLAEQITTSRTARGWTMSELAKAAGVSVGVVHKLESGGHVRDHTRDSVIRALGARLEQALVFPGAADRSSRQTTPTTTITSGDPVVVLRLGDRDV